jgi:hypothetical protein
VEAQFSTVIYEAFQNAVKNPNLLQVITILFLFSKSTVYYNLQIWCRWSQNVTLISSVRPVVRALLSAHVLQVRARVLSAPLSSAPRDPTRSRTVSGSRPKLSAPMPVPACTRSCSGWRSAGFRGQPPHTANRHVGGQQ